MFAGFRRIFRGVARFFKKSPDFLRKVTIFYGKAGFFTKSHDFLRKVMPGGSARGALRHALPHPAKRPYRCRAGIYPPTFFSPGPADPIPPEKGGAGRRGNNNNTTTTR